MCWLTHPQGIYYTFLLCRWEIHHSSEAKNARRYMYVKKASVFWKQHITSWQLEVPLKPTPAAAFNLFHTHKNSEMPKNPRWLTQNYRLGCFYFHARFKLMTQQLSQWDVYVVCSSSSETNITSLGFAISTLGASQLHLCPETVKGNHGFSAYLTMSFKIPSFRWGALWLVCFLPGMG